MPSIVTNFKFKSSAPNFERDQVNSTAQLANAKKTDYDRGHIVYCTDTNKYYSFGTDPELWRLSEDDAKLEPYGYFSIFNSGTGGSGSSADKNGAYRTVFLFKTTKHEENPNKTPDKPEFLAWRWNNALEDIECIKEDKRNGWELDKDMEPPIWMSIGSLNINFPSDITWTMPTRVTGEHGISYHYIYRKTVGQNAPSIPAMPTDAEKLKLYRKDDNYLPPKPAESDGEDTWWTPSMSGVDDEVRFEWMCYRKKMTNDAGELEWGDWIGDENGKAVLVNFYSEKEYTTMYYLNVNPLVIKEDKYGKKETNELLIGVYYKKGDEVKYVSKIPDGYKVECIGDGISNQVLRPNSTELKFDVKSATGKVTVSLVATEDGVDRIVDMETIPLLKDGNSNIVTDLTNDSYSITCNNFGDPINDAEEASTEFKMYYGLDQRPIESASIAFKVHEGNNLVEKTLSLDKNKNTIEEKYADFYVKTSLSSDYVSLTVNQVDEVALAGMDFLITGKTTVNGKEMTSSSTFTVRKVIPGGKTPTLYQLVPSASSISKSKPDASTGAVTFSPSTIGVKLIRIQGESDGDREAGKITELSSIPSGMKIVVYKDGQSDTTATEGMAPPTNVETMDVNESLEFKLLNDNSIIHDIYIPLMKDGMDSTIYQLKPDTTTVRIYQDGTYSTSNITLSIQEIIGNNIKTLNSIPSGMELWVGYDHGTLSKSTSMTIKVNSATKMITVELRSSNKVLDRLMIPVVSDGRDGETTTIYSINASSDVIKISADGSGITPAKISAGALKKAGQGIVSADDAVDIIAVANINGTRYYIKKDGSGASTTVFNETRNENFVMSANTQITINKSWSAVEFYIFKDDGTMVDHEAIPILRDSESAIMANLTNDMLAIQCDQNGGVIDTANKTTTFEMYYGTVKQVLSSLTATSPNGLSSSCNKSTGVVTISNIGSLNADSVIVTITGTDSSGRSLSKDLKVVKIKKGAKGDKGDKGDPGLKGDDGQPGADGYPGEKGAKLRMTTYSPYGPNGTSSKKTSYLCGATGEEFYDVVIYGDVLYLCIKTHTGGTAAPGDNTYWTKAAYWDFAATKLLLAEKISADQIDVDQLTAAIIETGLIVTNRLETSGNGSKIVIENGIMNVFNNSNIRNIQFGVDDNGYAVLKYYDNNGKMLYNLGPDGINKLETKAASFSQARYLRLCGTYDPAFPYKDAMEDPNGNQVYKTAKDSFNSSEATYLYTSGKVLGVVQHPEYDGVCFRGNRVNSSTNLPIDPVIPDGIYCLSAVSQAEANSAGAKYPQWDTMNGRPTNVHPYNEPFICDSNSSIRVCFTELHRFEGGREVESVVVYWNISSTSGGTTGSDGRL